MHTHFTHFGFNFVIYREKMLPKKKEQPTAVYITAQHFTLNSCALLLFSAAIKHTECNESNRNCNAFGSWSTFLASENLNVLSEYYLASKLFATKTKRRRKLNNTKNHQTNFPQNLSKIYHFSGSNKKLITKFLFQNT